MHPNSEPIESVRCPVCGHQNRCERAEGKDTCWCFIERVDQALTTWLQGVGIDSACLCRVCATQGVRSPCMGTCTLDEATDTCHGCGRTSHEIARWPIASSIERARILLRLDESSGASEPR
ncbi:MAG: cysteine-rich CWC family protein [Planctomycetes bacterium]|nr:cysteine-rich CWC family protein [Planctomycetota bacterium]MCB9891277.1 cysteine-rich CWC family protein [Planctomycetota bacterium]MCB9919464.1 cysteine-rich CWC family protein [Planctomycetota bacterium]